MIKNVKIENKILANDIKWIIKKIILFQVVLFFEKMV